MIKAIPSGLTASLLILATAISAVAADRQSFVGSWGGGCGYSQQCLFDVAPKGNDFVVDLKITPRNDDTKVLCHLKGVLQKADTDLVAGHFGSSKNFGIFVTAPDTITVKGGNGKDCGFDAGIDGEYHIIAD